MCDLCVFVYVCMSVCACAPIPKCMYTLHLELDGGASKGMAGLWSGAPVSIFSLLRLLDLNRSGMSCISWMLSAEFPLAVLWPQHFPMRYFHRGIKIPYRSISVVFLYAGGVYRSWWRKSNTAPETPNHATKHRDHKPARRLRCYEVLSSVSALNHLPWNQCTLKWGQYWECGAEK